MGSAGNDGVVDPQPHPDEGGPGERSFDPGLATGYLRRAPRDHELSPELGAAPFDPGPERYDDRRASKDARRRQREARRRQPAQASVQEPPAATQRVDTGRGAQAAALQPAREPDPVLPTPPPAPEHRPASVTE